MYTHTTHSHPQIVDQVLEKGAENIQNKCKIKTTSKTLTNERKSA